MENYKEVFWNSTKLFYQPLTWGWNRIRIEYQFVKNLVPRRKFKITYKNQVNLAKALRLIHLNGIINFHFSFTDDYYKQTPDERCVEYINLIHNMILIDKTPENGFTPMKKFDD